MGLHYPAKKFWVSTIIHFGGHIIDSNENRVDVRPDKGKMQPVRDFLEPKNRDDIHCFLGIVNTFKPWHSDLSSHTEAVSAHNKAKTLRKWGSYQVEAFMKVNLKKGPLFKFKIRKKQTKI